MNLRVMSWNAEGMFVEGSMTRRASPDDALAVLREVGADIVVVPEFGVFERMSEKTSSAIAALGYTMEQLVHLVYIELGYHKGRSFQFSDKKKSLHCKQTK